MEDSDIGMEIEENSERKPGRPRVSLEKASPRTLKRRFDPLDSLVNNGMSTYFVRVNDTLVQDKELLEQWHEARLQKDTQVKIGIGENLISASSTFPSTSTSRTVFVQNATEGISARNFVFRTHVAGLNGVACARVFGQSPQSIYNARNAPPKFLGELATEPVERDKISLKIPLLNKWIATLDLKSGMRHHPVN